jgi:hypothetical protein
MRRRGFRCLPVLLTTPMPPGNLPGDKKAVTGLTAYHRGTSSRPINDADADPSQTADGP